MCAQYSPAPSQNSTSRPLKTLPTTYLYEDGLKSYLIDTTNPSPDFYINFENHEHNQVSASPLSDQSYSTILAHKDLTKLAEYSPANYPTMNIPNRNNPRSFRKHIETTEKHSPFHGRNQDRSVIPPEMTHKIDTAKSLLDQLYVNRDRHIGLKSYYESLNKQLAQSLQIGIAELRAKRNAIMAQLDARLNEVLHIIQIKHKEKEKVLKEKSQEVEWFLKGIQDSVQKLQNQIEGENRVNIFKNLDLILNEAEKGLTIWAPESDINSEWAYVNLPEFNYTLAPNAISSSHLYTPKSQSFSIKNSAKKSTDISKHFRRNFSETMSPIKGENKKVRIFNEVGTSPIKEVSRITIDESDSIPTGSIDITKKIDYDYEFDPLDTNRRRKLRPPRIPKLDLPNFEPDRKDHLIVELMSAYKELETFYNWSKYGFSIPAEMKPRSFQKLAEDVVDQANIENIKKEVTDRMLNMLKSSNLDASDYKSVLGELNPEIAIQQYYEKILKSNQEMAKRIEKLESNLRRRRHRHRSTGSCNPTNRIDSNLGTITLKSSQLCDDLSLEESTSKHRIYLSTLYSDESKPSEDPENGKQVYIPFGYPSFSYYYILRADSDVKISEITKYISDTLQMDLKDCEISILGQGEDEEFLDANCKFGDIKSNKLRLSCVS